MEDKPPLIFERLNTPQSGLTSMRPRVYRVKILGGWLIYMVRPGRAGATFVPDPDHKWDGGSLP
jgi:hypothetical protein